MHMADTLVSVPVAAVAGAVAVTLIGVASAQVKKETSRPGLTSLMGVLGAFVFAAQMINFTIPGTGSSGHIIGGVLLASMLGPWAAFLTLCSVLIIQCFVFADGGMMALGCNLINMGAMSCLVAYPLLFKPIVKGHVSSGRLMLGSVVACTVGLELGAFLVSIETVASGITELPMGKFLLFMLPIHIAIGICEGVATGLVLVFVHRTDPALLSTLEPAHAAQPAPAHASKASRRKVLWVIGAVAVVFAVAFTWIASSCPDGLEWSIERMTGDTELGPSLTPATAFMPDYDSKLAGIIGGIITMVMVWAIGALLFRRRAVKVPVSRR